MAARPPTPTRPPLLLLALSLAGLAGCPAPRRPAPPPVAPPQAVAAPAAGLREVPDTDGLLSKALGAPGAGGVTSGAVYSVTAPGAVAVYRIFGGPARENGRWWALVPAAGTAEEFRKNFGICPLWNDLSREKRCTLKAGARVVIGPGQSVDCKAPKDAPAAVSYGASTALQVYLDQPDAMIEGCEPMGPWPASSPADAK
jgi:hypothetical protein